MATEVEIDLNDEPVRPEEIEVYRLKDPDPPETAIESATVTTRTPVEGAEGSISYEVDVEFVPEDRGLFQATFEQGYLNTFEEARLTQEAVTKQIERDLKEALGIEEVFVAVSRTTFNKKFTWSR